MEIIALTGVSGVGKTTTLNILYSILIANGFVQVPGNFYDHANNDFMDILERGSLRLGFATQGDYSRALPQYLNYLETNGCHKTVCACTTIKIGTVKAINAYKNTPYPKTINKVYNTQRVTNTNDAIHLYSLI